MFSPSFSHKTSFILLLPFFLTACSKQAPTEFVKNVVITQAQQGDLQTEFHLTGTLEASSSAYVSAKSPGRISSLLKDVGDSVVANELIGYLGGEENKSGYNTAATTVSNLSQNLSTVTALTQKQIENAQKELKNAQQNLELIQATEKNIEITSTANLRSATLAVEQAKLNYESAQKTLTDTQAQLAQESLNLADNAKSSITQALILVNLTESTLDNLLGVTKTNEHNNDSFEKYLGTLNQNTRTQAAISLRESITLNAELQKFYDTKISLPNPNPEDLKQGLSLSQKTLEQNKTSLEDAYNVLEASTTGNNFSLENLNSYKQQITTLGSQVESANLSVSGSFVVGVKGVLQGSENLKIFTSTTLNQVETGVTQAQKMYEIAEQELTKLQANIQMQKDDIRIKKNMATTQLEQAHLGIETAKINQSSQTQILQTQLDQAKGQEKLASVNVANTEIRAPFDGVITDKMVEIGTVINAGTPVFKIETPQALKIMTEIPEQDIHFITLGQNAELFTLNQNDSKYSGQITKIEPAANPYSHKIGIEISVENLSEKLKIGTIFNLTIVKELKQNTLILPLDSLLNLYGETFIFVVTPEQTAQKVLVKTGIISDKQIEILEGITLQDQIVIKGQNNLRNGDKVKIMQNLSQTGSTAPTTN